MSESGINWGKVLLGAGIVAGAVLLAPVVIPHIQSALTAVGGVLADLGSWINTTVMSLAGSAADAGAKEAAQQAAQQVAALAAAPGTTTLEAIAAAKTALVEATAKSMGTGFIGLVNSNQAIAGVGAAVAGGAAMLCLDGRGDSRNSAAPLNEEVVDSHAARHEMRVAEARMLARMAATGYQPAMAMVNQPTR